MFIKPISFNFCNHKKYKNDVKFNSDMLYNDIDGYLKSKGDKHSFGIGY